jgi:hypothetical protein
MIRGTTPTHIFTIPFETDLIKDVRVIYAQNSVVVVQKNISSCKLGDHELSVSLSQEETLKFDCTRPVEIQLKINMVDTSVVASNIMLVDVGKVLSDEVM